MYYPRTDYNQPTRLFTDTFYGYNHNLKIADGEWHDMQNLTSDCYPLMSARSKRGYVETAWNELHGIIFKDALIYIDGNYVYMNGAKIEGPVLSTDVTMLPKTLISMGAYLCIFPDKMYINTADITEWGYMEQRNSIAAGEKVEYSLCKADGTAYEITANTASPVAPNNPTNGQVWIDTSGETHALKQFNSSTGMWVSVATVYVKISAPGISTGLSKWDGIVLSGLTITEADTGYSEQLQEQVEALNGAHILYEVGNGYIVVVGLLDKVITHTTEYADEAKFERTVPEMDFITEANNRLWGCRYGLNEDGKTVNEIYCCALGDFKNWTRYLGVSSDSYAASVGSDGQWTGAASYMGYPIFFKENCMHKVYVSTSGAHQIVETQCRGIMKGSHRSAKVVGERLYYLSQTGVMVYDGSLPVSVHSSFGNERYRNGVGGRLLDKYYISMQNEKDEWNLFVYDTAKRLWHREDNTKAEAFAEDGTELYFIDTTGGLVSIRGTEGTEEENVVWEAVTGLLGYEYADRKYITRINIRAILPEGSDMDIYMEYDSSGEWVHCGHYDGHGTDSTVFTIRPRRCDHFRYKINGTGDIKIYSIAKNIETGSDVE